jgi:hypothetical protein
LEPDSPYAERSARYSAGATSLKQNGPFSGSKFYRPVTNGSSQPPLPAEASPLQKQFSSVFLITLSFPDRLCYPKDDKYVIAYVVVDMNIDTP